MPELPEVEVTRRGLAPDVSGRCLTGVVVRQERLRFPVPTAELQALLGAPLLALERRAKYLLFRFASGTVIVHLGMSGSLRWVPLHRPVEKHDHVDLQFGDGIVRLRDPRRFGAVLWQAGAPEQHSLLAHLGIEPLSAALTGPWLHQALQRRRLPIKQAIMDGKMLVGVGNIYASESLFRARIHPETPANTLTSAQCQALAEAIRITLDAALAAGGSTLRDFIQSDGRSGYFQQEHFVYGRAGLACRCCATPIAQTRQGNRSSFYCPHCQPLG